MGTITRMGIIDRALRAYRYESAFFSFSFEPGRLRLGDIGTLCFGIRTYLFGEALLLGGRYHLAVLVEECG